MSRSRKPVAPRDPRGHRKRLFAKFDSADGLGLADYEMIEMLLCYAVPQRDMREISRNLIDRFGSIDRLMEATPQSLQQTPGIGESSARLLRLVRVLQRESVASSMTPRHAIADRNELLERLYDLFSSDQRERLAVVFLAPNLSIIGIEVVSEGTLSSVPISARQIVSKALERGATSIVLAHNHPSGFLMPSDEDIRATQALQRTGRLLEIEIFDHFLIGNRRFYSMRDEGLIYTTLKF